MPVEEGDILALPFEVADQGVHAEEDPILPVSKQDIGLAPLPFARMHVHLPHPSVTNPLETENFCQRMLNQPVNTQLDLSILN